MTEAMPFLQKYNTILLSYDLTTPGALRRGFVLSAQFF